MGSMRESVHVRLMVCVDVCSFAARSSARGTTTATATATADDEAVRLDEVEFDANYGLLPPEHTVIIRAYSDDTDDQVLSDIRPRYIVMYEPNQEFIRRIEVSSGNIIMIPPHTYIPFSESSHF